MLIATSVPEDVTQFHWKAWLGPAVAPLTWPRTYPSDLQYAFRSRPPSDGPGGVDVVEVVPEPVEPDVPVVEPVVIVVVCVPATVPPELVAWVLPPPFVAVTVQVSTWPAS